MKQPQLGKKLLELRQQKGLTQEELVARCNISVRTIQRIEAGESSPRVYTIKTILAALDRDLDDLKEESTFETKIKGAMLLEIDETRSVAFLIKNLQIGWIAGVLSMIVFTFEAVDDFYYITQESYYFGKGFTLILGICSILFFSLFMRSFILIGTLFKHSFLRTIAILFIVTNALIASYALIDMNFTFLPTEAYGVLYAVAFGMMMLFFGYALYKLKGVGNLPYISGIVHIILGAMMVTIILGIIAGPISILTQGLQVVIILKAIEVLKQHTQDS